MGLVKSLSPGNVPDDPWFRLLGACKKQAANAKTTFIHDVRVGHEPLCVMTTNRHVNDLRRFGCSPYGVSPSSREPPPLCTPSTVSLPGIRPPLPEFSFRRFIPLQHTLRQQKKENFHHYVSKISQTSFKKFQKHLSKNFKKHLSKNSCPALKNRVFRKT